MQWENDLPVLNQFAADDFVDLVLKIQNLKSDDNFYYFDMRASFEGKIIGASARIIKNISPGIQIIDDNPSIVSNNVYDKGLVISSIGEESDDLVFAIAKSYNIKLKSYKMIQSESYTVLHTNINKVDIAKEKIKLKIFGRDNNTLYSDEDYYESFFNVDIVNGFVFWNEKDPHYRLPLLRALGSG